jgi:hypothetical protein
MRDWGKWFRVLSLRLSVQDFKVWGLGYGALHEALAGLFVATTYGIAPQCHGGTSGV